MRRKTEKLTLRDGARGSLSVWWRAAKDLERLHLVLFQLLARQQFLKGGEEGREEGKKGRKREPRPVRAGKGGTEGGTRRVLWLNWGGTAERRVTNQPATHVRRGLGYAIFLRSGLREFFFPQFPPPGNPRGSAVRQATLRKAHGAAQGNATAAAQRRKRKARGGCGRLAPC